MNSITQLWTKNKEIFDGKSIQQILAFTGEGKLLDNSQTSIEFREFLENIPTEKLRNFSIECLNESFNNSGIVLQDLINEIGSRLGFKVENGLYRGKKNSIGFDGIWTSKEEHQIVVEVKTTDAYRINLNVIAEYRNKLVETGKLNKSQSSILIVVGRQDTGDLEAQIRGSKHAWDVRLISTDSLLNLLELKENLNDAKTLQQINELLKPREYTRIDKLIELIFITSKDLQLEEETEDELEEIKDEETKKIRNEKEKTKPVKFHESCIDKIKEHLGVNLIKSSRISYESKSKSIRVMCSVSKVHKSGKSPKYWFAFHPHQKEYLEEHEKSYIAYGCGSAENTFLFDFDEFKNYYPNMWTTERNGRMYWHVVIINKSGKFYLQQPQVKKGEMIDITKNKIKNEEDKS